MPGHAYWKNLDSVYMGCNLNMAKASGLDSPEDIIGKTDKDFSWGADFVNEFIKEDQKVINEVLPVISTYDLLIDGSLRTFRTEKSPLTNENNEIFGILGFAIDITAEKEAEELKLELIEQENRNRLDGLLKNCINEISNNLNKLKLDYIRYNSTSHPQTERKTSDYQQVKLTKRELQILYFLNNNKSPKEIANILSKQENKQLAPATVLSIICKQLYPKFEVGNTGSLIEKAHTLNLIPLILDTY
jgi:hypothetical protein